MVANIKHTVNAPGKDQLCRDRVQEYVQDDQISLQTSDEGFPPNQEDLEGLHFDPEANKEKRWLPHAAIGNYLTKF